MADTRDAAIQHRLDLQAGATGGDLLAAVLDVAGCMVVILDSDDRIVLFNKACELLTGYPFDEIKGEHVWNRLLVPEEIEPVKTVLGELRTRAVHNRFDSFWVTRDGDRRLIRWSNASLGDDRGHPRYIISTGVDITDARRIQGESAEREARLQAILDTAVEGIITIDDGGIVESINPAAERIFGYAPEEVIGHNVSMLMPAPHSQEHDGYIRRYLKTREPKIIGIGREERGQRKDGSVFPIELAVSEVQFPDRRLFTGIVRDISDRRQAEEQARLRLREVAHASRLLELGEMSSGIAHEVNQPLTAIVSFAEACLRMLESGGGDPTVMKNALAQIAEQGGRAGEIIHRLRRFMQKGETHPERFDLNTSILDVLGLLKHEVLRAGVRVKLELDPELPRVVADKVQVEQVLLNVLRNAVEAMSELEDTRRRLTVASTARQRESVRIRVSDTGKGLPEADSARVFETFFTTKSQGVGVGLAISQSIIDAHGGRMWAESNAGHGATFCFELPLRDKA